MIKAAWWVFGVGGDERNAGRINQWFKILAEHPHHLEGT